MKWILRILSVIFVVFQIIVICFYFKTFHGGISKNVDDWDLFYQLTNGFIMVILTCINIYVFYNISIMIEKNNGDRTRMIEENNIKRYLNNRLFEAQSFITQIRIKQYEEIRDLVGKIQVQAIRENLNDGDIDAFKKKLMNIDNSFLYKNDNLDDPSFFDPIIQNVLKEIENFNDPKKLYDALSNFIRIFEVYIITQMLRDKDVTKYIEENKDRLDSTISCVDLFIKKLKHTHNGKPN